MLSFGCFCLYLGAGIFINSVTVRENEGADQEYLFACNSWLDDHMEDRQTQRQLQLLGELLLKLCIYVYFPEWLKAT